VFGYLGGGALPYDLKTPGADFVLALQALPAVLVMSVLTALLFHWRSFLRWSVDLPGCSNARSASVARSTLHGRHIFLGMVEAPLFIRPYLRGSRAASFSLS